MGGAGQAEGVEGEDGGEEVGERRGDTGAGRGAGSGLCSGVLIAAQHEMPPSLPL